MAEIKVLLDGYHKNEDDRLFLSSTVTLIKSEGKNILVDTGHLWVKDDLIKSLKNEKLKPQEIDILVLTHTHLDHTLNSYLFDNAKIITKFAQNYPGQQHEIGESSFKRIDISDGQKLTKDIEYLITPGHSIDGITLLVQTKYGVVAVAGDAISSEVWANENLKPNPGWVYSMELFDKSRTEILAKADFVVPGHGKMFEVIKV